MTATELTRCSGFSLVEILVALFVVSLTAVNISGLQKLVGEQNRDNFIHCTALELAIERMEKVLQFELMTDFDELIKPENKDEIIATKLIDFTLNWSVVAPTSAYGAGDNVRNVTLKLDWKDSKGEPQVFAYSEQVNLSRLLNTNGNTAAEEAAIIESFIESNEVIYFESKMGYQAGAFVIYNSELFKATNAQSVGNSHPRDVVNPIEVADGWESYGSIDNPDLANNPDLATLFLD